MNSYVVTDRDRVSMIEIMRHAWNVSFKATRDRPGASYTRRDGTYVEGIPPYTRWDVQAVNPANNTYHTTDGDSITEAVNKWFMRAGILIPKTREIGEFESPEWNAAQ